MERERKVLTREQAISLLPDGDYIHTFLSSIPNVLVGMDWSREEILKEINSYSCEIGGEMCRTLNHGLVIMRGKNDPLFVEVREDVLNEIDGDLNGHN